MKELVEYIARALVDHPDDVKVPHIGVLRLGSRSPYLVEVCQQG